MGRDMDLVRRVVTHNELHKNVMCCIQEMAELTQELTRWDINSEKFSPDHLLEETAHALLMIKAVAQHFGMPHGDMYDIQLDAVERMEQSTENEGY